MAAQLPLPSQADEKDEPVASDGDDEETESTTPAAPARPPPPAFKISTFVLTFLFILGLWMIFDNSTRNGVATTFGFALAPLIGFNHSYLLLTMFLAAVIEMLLTAAAYNWTTDWVKAAKVQSWSTAFRKVQMAAMKSGKKDRVEALKPRQNELTKLSGEVSIAQLKGMAVTWFLVIAIYTWVGLFILQAASLHTGGAVVSLGGAQVNLLAPLHPLPIPVWFLLFTLYTVPLSLVFRRVLKHYALLRYERAHGLATPAGAGAAGPSA
ncbi:MAG TPA: EMC3/TMCO1 family protein [Thermoplasmata archaeon]|nr:EMC3/TMCO1 family protein [Thermoplasmata archaeon]